MSGEICVGVVIRTVLCLIAQMLLLFFHFNVRVKSGSMVETLRAVNMWRDAEGASGDNVCGVLPLR